MPSRWSSNSYAGDVSDIALGGYPAKSCPRATHNRFTTEVPKPVPDPPSPELQQRFDDGIAFECTVMDYLVELGAEVIPEDFSVTDATAQTLRYLHDRVGVIGRACLPTSGPRTGRPDLLVLVDGGYLPVDVKNHSLLKPKTERSKKPDALVSAFDAPADFHASADFSAENGSWLNDAMQLAHYTRMLEDLGLHAGPDRLLGGVVSNDDLTDLLGAPHGICWFDLDTPCVTQFAAEEPSGRAEFSVLSWYDREFARRLEIAVAAAAGEELVAPLGTAECPDCSWYTYCSNRASSHPSFLIRGGPLRREEWEALERFGGETLPGLASLDEASVRADFVRSSVNTRSPEQRLTDTLRRARMLVADPPRTYEPHDGVWPSEVPAADVEVDFDLEWDSSGRIFQWGMRVRKGQDDTTARYLDHLVAAKPLDDDVEQELAQRALQELSALAAQAAAAGQVMKVFHWSHPEVSMTRKFPEIEDLLAHHAVDLLGWWRDHFFTVHGNGIKNVATLFDYDWQVADPAGLKAELKLAQAHEAYPDPASWDAELFAAARAQGPDTNPLGWVLLYNESDVEAQARIRDGLRAAINS